MESELIRLVSWRRDASSDEALQAVVKAVHTGFGTRLATGDEAATQMALRYEDDDGEMCRLTALTLEDCLDISSNVVKLFVERVPLEARADRSVSLEVQDSVEVQADETSLSAVMSVDSGHRAITVEAAADVCKGPLCCGGGREAHVDLGPAMAGRLDRRGVLRYTHIPTPLEHSTSPLHDTTDATRRTHELALCDRCHTAWASGAHVWVPAGHPRYTRAPYGEGAVGGSFTRRQFTTW